MKRIFKWKDIEDSRKYIQRLRKITKNPKRLEK